MDTAAWGAVGTVVLTAGSLGVAWLTRRSAKDTTAVDGFTKLTDALQEERRELREERQADRSRIDALERNEAERLRLARVHERWDQSLVDRLRQAFPEESFPDPPPLDIEA